MHRIYKFRIYPTLEQQELINKTFSGFRFIFNHMLTEKDRHYKQTGKYYKNTPAQYKNEFLWLRDIDSIALSYAARELDTQFKAFMRKKGRYPLAKKINENKYKTLCINGNIRVENGYIKLPKIGLVRINQHREIPDEFELKAVVVQKDILGRYFVHIDLDKDCKINWIKPTNSVGIAPIDNGICVLSDGLVCEVPNIKLKTRLNIEQFKLSRCRWNSNNWNKQKAKMNKAEVKLWQCKKDYMHKMSYEIANTYDAVYVAKVDLSKTDNDYILFLTMLNYKLIERGKRLIQVSKIKKSLQGIDLAIALNNREAHGVSLYNRK